MPTQNLGLPFIAPAQAQKHITVNTAFQKLDIAINISVKGLDVTTPPITPVEGDRFALSDNPIEGWVDHGGAIAALQNGVWEFFHPTIGTVIWDEDSEAIYVRQASGWQPVISETNFQNLPHLGINAQADEINRLAVSAPATLFNHHGDGHQLKINRATQTDTASVAFQTNFEGVAEIGLNGNAALSVKTKQTDGSWVENLSISPDSTGIETPRLSSGQITIDEDSVGEILTPRSGGIIAIIMAGDSPYPQATHSGLFAYDTGPSRSLHTLTSAPNMKNKGDNILTGTSGEDDATSISVRDGVIQIENRFTNTRDYSYTFLV